MTNIGPVIIYRLGSLGDTVVALPCLHKVAASFPAVRRILLTNYPVAAKAAPVASILGPSGLIDEVIGYPVGTRSPSVMLGLRRRIRALAPSALIYLTPARGQIAAMRDYAFFRLCGIPRIIGAPVSRDLQYNRVDPGTGIVEPEAQRLVRTIAPLGAIDLADPAAWNLKVTASEEREGLQVIAPFAGTAFIAINMGGKAVENDWGEDRWRQLLRVAAERYREHGFLVVGAADEAERAARATSGLPSHVINACGALSARVSAAALQHAAAFIGHDSGPIHLASAMRVRCVGLYSGRHLPAKWHPYGNGNRIIHRMTGIENITVAEVLDALAVILSARL